MPTQRTNLVGFNVDELCVQLFLFIYARETNIMKMPSKVKIYGVDYKLEHKVIEEQGVTFFDRQVIYINDDYPLEYQKVTVIHEIMHVLLHQKNTYILDAIADVKSSDTQEHLVINTFDWTLYEVLKGNPKLRRWLWDAEEK